MQKQSKIAFLGGGNMTQSLIHGLISSGFEPGNLIVSDRHPEKLKFLAAQFGIQTESSNRKTVSLADILVLAVKPQNMRELIQEIKETIQTRKPLMISIAAGIQTRHLEHWLDAHLAIVRAMPNTPALVRVGATGLYANLQVSEEQKNRAETLLRAVGITLWVNHEHELDTVAALSGSGPAYFFLMMEALQEASVKLGLTHSAAKLLTLQTALGAARMALESEDNLEELRHRIASPGGITERALSALEDGGIRSLFENALQAAKDRSIEISQLLDKE